MNSEKNTTHEKISGGRVFLFFGVVGAGKGTQIELLQEYLAKHGEMSHYLYPGNFFREIMKREDITAERIGGYMNKGKLVPDFITNAYVNNYVLHSYVAGEHIIFDGYPRSIAQAESIIDLIKFYGWENIDVITIDISEEEAIKRLLARGRHDDTDEGIRERVRVYNERVLPALEMLTKNITCRNHVINGEQSIEDVHADVMSALAYNHK